MNLELLAKKINQLLEKYGTPSVQLGIIRDDKIIFNQAFGYSNVERKEKATKDTVYAIASCTKAFVAMGIAKLVDEGKLEWDKTIKEYIPWFEMYDENVSKSLTVRDILCHRCGLPRHDTVWYLNPNENRGLIEKLKYLEPSKPFRTTLQYQNIMYALAGYLIEEVTGTSWGDYIEENITKSIGMEVTSFGTEEAIGQGAVATPYENDGKAVKSMDHYMTYRENIIDASGSIYSNTTNMLKWVQFNLNEGFYKEEEIVGNIEVLECHTPQMINRTMRSKNVPEIDMESYGLGWFIESFKGHKLVYHGGNINGFVAMVAFIPKSNAGFCFLINEDESILQDILHNAITEFLLGHNRFDYWEEVFVKERENMTKMKKDSLDSLMTGSNKDVPMPLNLNEYVGKYSHKAYGDIEVRIKDEGLVYEYAILRGELEHVNLNTVFMKLPILGNVPMKFNDNILGKIVGLNLHIEPSIPDGIEFVKKS